MQTEKVKVWQKSDINGFFGLFTNNIANILVLTSLLLYVIELPADIVFRRILPGVGIAIFISCLCYFYAGYKLSKVEKRDTVTALPTGISVPHMFIIVFGVMLPIKLQTGDPMIAWYAGLAWCLIEAVIECLGAVIGKKVREFVPRAALLGSLAGVSIPYIMTNSAAQAWGMPAITIVCLGVLLMGWIAKKKMPWGMPAGLVAIVVGTAIGWGSGRMSASALVQSFSSVGFALPGVTLGVTLQHFTVVLPYLLIAIPFGIYNFIETMDNLESAEVAGDKYNTTQIMLFDGITSFIGGCLGNPVPTAVYIGHPGWKSVGARLGYGWMTGLGVLLLTLLGIESVLLSAIPIAALLPILIYIGVVIGSQAFENIPKSHTPAVVMAILPSLADWCKTMVSNAVVSAGSNPGAIAPETFAANGIYFGGLTTLGSGAIVVGIIWATITVFLIERKQKQAIVTSCIAAALSFFGIIHAAQVGFAAALEVSIGYLLLAALILLFFKQEYIEESL